MPFTEEIEVLRDDSEATRIAGEDWLININQQLSDQDRISWKTTALTGSALFFASFFPVIMSYMSFTQKECDLDQQKIFGIMQVIVALSMFGGSGLVCRSAYKLRNASRLFSQYENQRPAPPIPMIEEDVEAGPAPRLRTRSRRISE